MRVLVFLTVLAAGCGGSNLAGSLAHEPAPSGDFEAKCSAAKPDDKPLVVALSSSDKVAMEATAKSGPLVVKYQSCQIELLSRCKAPGAYTYAGITPKKDKVDLKNEDDLYAKLPLGALSVLGDLKTHGSLSIATSMVGRFHIDAAAPDRAKLEGDCEGATHWAAALTVGAYRMAAGADADISAKVGYGPAAVGGESSSSRSTLREDGDGAACAKASDGDAKPPFGCGALLRIELVPLKGAHP